MHRVVNLSHRYGNRWIFKHLSLEIKQGECLALLGESGCGKTTLLRNIAGLEKGEGGEIKLGDQLVYSDTSLFVPTAQRGIGLVFQDYALFPSQTVQQNIAFGISSQQQDRIQYLLDLIGLTSHANHYPHQLSGGQQQRVALARALAPKPKLLLLDEPFANIDAHRRMELGEELRRILSREQTSALFVTHDQNDALSLSDRVAVMGINDGLGYIAQCDKPEIVYTQPASPEVAKITGKTWILSGVAKGILASSPIGDVPLYKEHHGEVLLLIRPENLDFKQGEGTATVTFCACLGANFQLTITIDKHTSRLYSDTAITTGTTGRLSVKQPCWFWPLD